MRRYSLWIYLSLLFVISIWVQPSMAEKKLYIDFPEQVCSNGNLKNKIENACRALGENLLVGKGAWGFGLFDSYSCSLGEFSKAALSEGGNWILRMEMQQTYLVGTLYQIVNSGRDAKFRPEVSVRILSNPYTLELLANQMFARLVTAELLDRLPFQAPVNAGVVVGDFPKIDTQMASLQVHSPSTEWSAVALEFSAEKNAWILPESASSESQTSARKWWVHQAARAARATDIIKQRNSFYFAEIESAERQLYAKTPKEVELIRKERDAARECLVQSKGQIDSEKTTLVPEQRYETSAGNKRWRLGAYGLYLPQVGRLNNTIEAGANFSPARPNWLSSMQLSWSFLSTKIPTQQETRVVGLDGQVQSVLQETFYAYRQHYFSLGTSTWLPVGPIDVTAQLRLGMVQQEIHPVIVTGASDPLSGIRTIWGTTGVSLGVGQVNLHNDWMIVATLDAGIQDSQALRQMIMAAWMNFDTTYFSRINLDPLDFRLGPYVRGTFLQTLVRVASANKNEIYEFPAVLMTFGVGGTLSW